MRLEKWNQILRKKSLQAESLISGFKISRTLISQLKSDSQAKAKDALIKVLRNTMKESEQILHGILYERIDTSLKNH